MKKDNKLHIKFHNPNNIQETSKFLTKLVASVAVEKYLNDISIDKGKQFKYKNSCSLSETNVV